MISQLQDFRAEVAEFELLLQDLPDYAWDTVTAFKDWTINDVVRHLHSGDMMALASATDTDSFRLLRAAVQARRNAGLTRTQVEYERLNGLSGRPLLSRWRDGADRLSSVLATLAPDARLAWAGPDMSLRMFTTARQMETWAHAQAVYDVLGQDRVQSDRLRNIAEIGVRTFAWTFSNRALPIPTVRPHVCLTAPSGAIWEWQSEPRTDEVSGSAFEFCQVVTQTRNVAETTLTVIGQTAHEWMSLAQCFAGPPEMPPPAGTRRKTMLSPRR